MLEPAKADADGLIECLSRALKSLGVENLLERESVLSVRELPVLVGCGTDGAVSDQNGMRGKLQACYAHRRELACKDAVISSMICC